VLVRPSRSQTGKSLIKIDGPGDWDEIFTIDWAGRKFYMNQFVDRRNEDGTFTLFRVAFINRKPYLRGSTTKEFPIVHGTVRTMEVARKEVARLDQLSESPTLPKVVEELSKRIQLNFWGIDLGYSADGDFGFYEATAAMSITSRSQISDEVMTIFARYLNPIFDHLKTAILTPSSWDCWSQPSLVQH